MAQKTLLPTGRCALELDQGHVGNALGRVTIVPAWVAKVQHGGAVGGAVVVRGCVVGGAVWVGMVVVVNRE